MVPVSLQFQPTPPSRAETEIEDLWKIWCKFQPTPPSRAETSSPNTQRCCRTYFNPLRPHGRRQGFLLPVSGGAYFNPLRPHGRRPQRLRSIETGDEFQPTPPSRAETPGEVPHRAQPHAISTHSALTGGDGPRTTHHTMPTHFNPLRPHGRRPYLGQEGTRQNRFQPTPPSRAETQHPHPSDRAHLISTHSALTGGD